MDKIMDENVKRNGNADTNKKIPNWKLERFILGELSADELNAIAELERSDTALRQRITALRSSNEEMLEKYPLSRMIKEARAGSKEAARGSHTNATRLSFWKGWKQGLPRWAPAALTCAAVLLILPLYIFSPNSSKDEAAALLSDNGIRIKGIESSLEVWRKSGEAAEKLDPGTGVSQGDVIQLRYLVPKSCYGTIVSLDGNGVVTVHLSGNYGKAAALTPGRPVALPHSYQLDDAPRFEIFYLVTSQENFDIDAITQSIQKVKKATDKPALPKDQQITIFTLQKHALI
ncbi:MAG: DUF4384 domain-containing protein [Chitinispirillales bacterium]|jgi:hypothetical protein|nr:DUF4384 domain-containing protein [Chitinispirillales bacterium]